MCNFGAQVEWRSGRRAISSYLDVDISNDQYHLVNPNPLDCIAGYTMGYYISDRDLNRPPRKRLNIIDGSIPSY